MGKCPEWTGKNSEGAGRNPEWAWKNSEWVGKSPEWAGQHYKCGLAGTEMVSFIKPVRAICNFGHCHMAPAFF